MTWLLYDKFLSAIPRYNSTTDEVDCRDVINQTIMEVLCEIRDSKENPVLQLRPITPDVSPVKQFSSSPLV